MLLLLSRALKIDLRMIISRDTRHLVSSDMCHCGHCGLITDNAGYNQLIRPSDTLARCQARLTPHVQGNGLLHIFSLWPDIRV